MAAKDLLFIQRNAANTANQVFPVSSSNSFVYFDPTGSVKAYPVSDVSIQVGTDLKLSNEWVVIDSDYTLVARDRILADSSLNSPVTFAMPLSPAQGDEVWISDPYNTWEDFPLTITSGTYFEGLASPLICDVAGDTVHLLYTGNGTIGWKIL